MDHQCKVDAAVKIALFLQKSFLGRKTRTLVMAIILQHRRRHACIIQNFFRRLVKRSYARRLKAIVDRNNERFKSSNRGHGSGDVTHRVLRRVASYDDYSSMWRRAIELRRACGANCRTDILLKSLIESKSDVARAIVLVETPHFYSSTEPEFSETVKRQFLPPSRQQVLGGAGTAVTVKDAPIIGNTGPVAMIRRLRKVQHNSKAAAGKSNRGDRGGGLDEVAVTEEVSDILAKAYYYSHKKTGPHKPPSRMTTSFRAGSKK